MESTKAQTGVWGELFVQGELLEMGIDSARMTTDYGVDLVAYERKAKRSFTIQVKTSGMALSKRRPDWKVKKHKLNDADLFAFVLKTGEAWYLSQMELKEYVRLYNSEWALTFYRTDAPKGRLTEADMSPFKGSKGIERFLQSTHKTRQRKAPATAA